MISNFVKIFPRTLIIFEKISFTAFITIIVYLNMLQKGIYFKIRCTYLINVTFRDTMVGNVHIVHYIHDDIYYT